MRAEPDRSPTGTAASCPIQRAERPVLRTGGNAGGGMRRPGSVAPATTVLMSVLPVA